MRPEAAAKRAGRLPTALPMAAKWVPLGSFCQALEGQNTRRPSSDTTAGTRVRPATRVTATAIARVGPRERNRLRVDRSSARKGGACL
jgi:hypothetical protein